MDRASHAQANSLSTPGLARPGSAVVAAALGHSPRVEGDGSHPKILRLFGIMRQRRFRRGRRIVPPQRTARVRRQNSSFPPRLVRFAFGIDLRQHRRGAFSSRQDIVKLALQFHGIPRLSGRC